MWKVSIVVTNQTYSCLLTFILSVLAPFSVMFGLTVERLAAKEANLLRSSPNVWLLKSTHVYTEFL